MSQQALEMNWASKIVVGLDDGLFLRGRIFASNLAVATGSLIGLLVMAKLWWARRRAEADARLELFLEISMPIRMSTLISFVPARRGVTPFPTRKSATSHILGGSRNISICGTPPL